MQTLYIRLIDIQWNYCYLLCLLLEWFVEHALTFEHLQRMDDSLGYIIWSFTDDYFVYLGILDIVDDHAETYRVREYAP